MQPYALKYSWLNGQGRPQEHIGIFRDEKHAHNWLLAQNKDFPGRMYSATEFIGYTDKINHLCHTDYRKA